MMISWFEIPGISGFRGSRDSGDFAPPHGASYHSAPLPPVACGEEGWVNWFTYSAFHKASDWLSPRPRLWIPGMKGLAYCACIMYIACVDAEIVMHPTNWIQIVMLFCPNSEHWYTRIHNMEGSYILFDCQSGRIPWAELGQRTCTLRDPCIADLPGATFSFSINWSTGKSCWDHTSCLGCCFRGFFRATFSIHGCRPEPQIGNNSAIFFFLFQLINSRGASGNGKRKMSWNAL